MKKGSNVLVSAALAGLFTASLAMANEHDAGAAAGGAEAKGECHGVNACKGKGECGGKGHSCAGQNACKGKGWMSMTKKECTDKKGKFKAKKA